MVLAFVNLKPLLDIKPHMHEHLNKFLEIVSSKIPGCLAVFDFADFKRRNCHLGHLAGDKDIEEFESILNKVLSEGDPWLRIAGDKWAVFTSENSLDKMNFIIRSYHRSEKVRVGWSCKASLGKETQQSETTVISTLSRALRCAYLPIISQVSLDEDFRKLTNYVGTSKVNTAQLYSSEDTDEPNKWTCITYPSNKQNCVFCENDQFEYLGDAFGPILSMEGVCKQCGAHLEYHEIFEPVGA